MVHAVLLDVSSLSERLSIGLLIIEGDRPWLEVIARRRHPVGVYDEGSRIRIVDGDSYITNRAYNLMVNRYELYGSLVMRGFHGIANLLYMNPQIGVLRMRPATGTLKFMP